MGERYAIREQLGRGGMACVSRAIDLQTGREVALKKLTPAEPNARANAAALFELEFHNLAQLRHPRVISVYDYGVDADGAPFYTMELLDGGDVRDRTPTPWRQACAWMSDVCSSLALLHSRRWVHRDVSPRNVRCTRDGRAKLIDFGAIAPMSPGGAHIVGTPAFIAPETFHRSALDARTDLFSLGATLYFVLTGQLPYPTQSFAELMDAWELEPMPPSTCAPDVPAELDDLVLAMLSVEPSMRPASAFEVMQRLAAVAGLELDESEAVTQAYLVTPTLVGRDEVLAVLRAGLRRTAAAEGFAAMLRGATGLGRSRLLDACALEAKTLGAMVLRANASGDTTPFAVALALTQHVCEAQPNRPLDAQYPELFERAPSSSGEPGAAGRVRLRGDLARMDPEQLQAAICRCLIATSEARPLLIEVDDIERMDEPSAAVLSALIDRRRTSRLFIALTAEELEGPHRVLDALAPRCEILRVAPLSRDDTRTLFASVFGDVANLDMLSNEIYDVALGNPQQSLAVAQHLIDQRAIRYTGCMWTLPSRVSAGDLPQSVEATVRTRIGRLSAQARFLAEAQSIAYFEVFELPDYHGLLPDVPSRTVDLAVSELFVEQALSSDGRTYSLANRVWVAALQAGLTPSELERRHLALVALYRKRSEVALIHHLFGAGLEEQALDELVATMEPLSKLTDYTPQLEQNAHKHAGDYVRAIATAQEIGSEAATRAGPPTLAEFTQRELGYGHVLESRTAMARSTDARYGSRPLAGRYARR